ncbi:MULTISPECIES: DUF6052 family protein [unclassified Streptomyces]|uniref:DUF6052 family protein n=1 Tax=unclassified Streptomyces TaxID=2593676 RepID=UPI00093DA45A|nr:DUF6052 family protein [Streptomyces sp. CB02400]OKJ97189.1 hypothetical protein AMK33_29815 [Streptomyces sp. CB02400]
MTNASSPLTAEQELHLIESYRTLTHLADTVQVPAVLASVRTCLAELRLALDGQAIDFDYYREPTRVLVA